MENNSTTEPRAQQPRSIRETGDEPLMKASVAANRTEMKLISRGRDSANNAASISRPLRATRALRAGDGCPPGRTSHGPASPDIAELPSIPFIKHPVLHSTKTLN